MGRWTSVITNAGLNLLARAQGNIFNFTKAQCGAGSVDVELLAEQTAISDYKKNLSITSIIETDNVTKLRLQLSNTSISGFNLFQIGVFAKLDGDATDVLFMIIQADTPDYIPSAAESPNFVNDYVVNVIIDNASDITGTVDLAAYVTVGQMNEYTDSQVNDLAGEGRTTETVKGNSDALKAHSESEMPHLFEDAAAQKTYKYGFKQQGNNLVFMFEEVV